MLCNTKQDTKTSSKSLLSTTMGGGPWEGAINGAGLWVMLLRPVRVVAEIKDLTLGQTSLFCSCIRSQRLGEGAACKEVEVLLEVICF